MKKTIIIFVAGTLLLSGCGQIDESDMPVIESGTSVSTTDNTTTETHTTRTIPKTTIAATFSTTETVTDTGTSTETETAYSELTTAYFHVTTAEKTEPVTTSEAATTEKSTEATSTTTETTITTTAVTTKLNKPVQADFSWTAARIDHSSEEWHGDEFALSAEDTKTIRDYCFGCKYEPGTCDCMGDYVFTMEDGAQIYYHTDCGVFNDFANERSYKTSGWMRDEINEILGRY